MNRSSVGQRSAPGSAAVVVVDVQNDFCHPDGAFGSAGAPTAAAVEMVPRLARFLDAARSAGVLVVFVRTTHDESTDSPAWLARTDGQGAPPRVTAICRTGAWGAEFYELAPLPGEAVVTKHRYSAFAGTNLDLILRTAGISSLLLTGVATETCVESTLRAGLFHEYYVTLVADCCASDHAEAHEATLSNVARLFGPVTTSEQIAAEWRIIRAVG